MAVTSHPPHRPVLAGTTAYGSYLGSTRCVMTSGDMQRRPRTPHCPWDTLFPDLCQARVRHHSVLLGHRPSLHHLRRRYLYRPCSAASLVLCRCSTPRWRSRPGCAFGFPGRSGGRLPRMPARSLGSRASSFSTCVRLLDYAGPDESSRLRSRQCGLPVACTRSAPGIRFSKLDSSPVDASVYTSPGTSRHPAQDLRSRWFATPFLWGSFIPDCTPVYPGACAC